MKKICITLLSIAFWATGIVAQDFSDLKGKMLKDSADYAEAQAKVVECYEFLLSTSVKNNENNLIAFDFLVEWMNNNPYYPFQPHKKFFKLVVNDAALSARYFAALCQVAVEKNFAITEEELQYQAIDKFLRYCMYKKYKVNVDKKLEKYIEAKKDGKLEKML